MSQDAARSSMPPWTRTVLAVAVLVTALGAIKGNVADPDLWGHVEFGREVLRTGTLPMRATWSFTSNAAWVNHENVAEIALAWTYDHGGIAGLIALKLTLTLLIFGLMLWRMCCRGMDWLTTGLTLLLVAKTMQFHWHFRPHVFGFAIFAVLVALLDWVFENWSGTWRSWADIRHGTPNDRPDAAVAHLKWLWIAPPLLALWTNTHGGYAAGVAIWSTYLILRAVEAWSWWGRTALPLMKRLAMMLCAGLLAICLNPYGPELHLWLAEDVWLPRPEIADWHPLWSLGSEAWPFGLLLGVSIVALTATTRRRDAVQLMILGLVLWQSLAHVRHVLFFAVLCGFWIPRHLASAFERLRSFMHDGREPTDLAPRTSSGWVAAALAWTAFVGWQIAPTLTDLPVETTRYPVAAMQFLRDHKLYGRTVVAFNWSQYAIACFAADPLAAPRARVAIDGRLRTCYPQEVIDVYLDLFLGPVPPTGRYRSPRSGPCDPARALSYGDPELLVLERRNRICREVMREAGHDWTLRYEDDLAQVWQRNDVLDAGVHPFIVADRSVSTVLRSVSWPALPEDRRLEFAELD